MEQYIGGFGWPVRAVLRGVIIVLPKNVHQNGGARH
jgi:hypothetical protein